MKAPTLTDVARHAGVSYATADRVINGRGKVAQKSTAKVLQAIEDLGYVRNVAAANLSQSRVYRFAFVLPKGVNAFIQKMRALVSEMSARLAADRITAHLYEVDRFVPGALAKVLEQVRADGHDGVALVASGLADAVPALEALRAEGMVVLTLVSDLPETARAHYVGIDNRAAGRTAARMIGLAHPDGRLGRALPVVAGLEAQDHSDRFEGFCETMAQQFPHVAIAREIEVQDRPDLMERHVAEALDHAPDITAIYNTGGGKSGLVRCLARLPANRPRPVVVAHDLVPSSREGLLRGLFDVVLDQRPDEEVARALSIMRRASDKLPVPPVEPIVPAIYVRENLPPVRQAQQA